MARTTEERIASVQKEIEELENRKKLLLKTQSQEKRKARTKRLIERGLIVESLIPDPESLTNLQVKEFLKSTLKTEFAQQELENILTSSIETLIDKQDAMPWHIGAAGVQIEAGGAEPAEV